MTALARPTPGRSPRAAETAAASLVVEAEGFGMIEYDIL